MATKRMFDPTSEAFRLSSSPFYLIAHADFIYHENMEVVLAERSVSTSTYRILTVLRDYQPCRMVDLADMALIKRTTVSRMVNRMHEQGLVETEQSASDSRSTEVRLSRAGRSLLDTLTPLVAPLFDHATRGLDHQELQRLLATLQIISANLGHRPDAAGAGQVRPAGFDSGRNDH